MNGSDEQKRTNEIKSVASMLDAFDIAGRTITADALHTQRAFAEYLVGLQGSEQRKRNATFGASVLTSAESQIVVVNERGGTMK